MARVVARKPVVGDMQSLSTYLTQRIWWSMHNFRAGVRQLAALFIVFKGGSSSRGDPQTSETALSSLYSLVAPQA